MSSDFENGYEEYSWLGKVASEKIRVYAEEEGELPSHNERARKSRT
jgi:hypothetical protein